MCVYAHVCTQCTYVEKLAGAKIEREEGSKRTLFANETVIAVIGVVRVPCDGAASVAYDSEVELCRDNAVSYLRSEM